MLPQDGRGTIHSHIARDLKLQTKVTAAYKDLLSIDDMSSVFKKLLEPLFLEDLARSVK